MAESKDTGILQTIRDFFSTTPALRELIGRSTHVVGDFWKQVIRRRARYSIDETHVDYEFWDRMRRGKADGFEIAGLFAKPITQILSSWVWGSTVQATLASKRDQYTNTKLQRFMRRNHGVLTRMLEDMYALGDQFVVINSDGSLSFPSPELVEVEYNPLDYRQMERVTIYTVTKQAEVIDVYTDQYRDVTIKWRDGSNRVESKRYSNLIGQIPIVHFANDRGANETNGRPVYEALYRLMERYDALIEKGLDGAELLGNPMPVFEDVEDVQEVVDANADPNDVYVDDFGEEHKVINWSRVKALFVSGKFNYKGPRADFTEDIRKMLKVLFLLILEFTRIPEAVWGGELTSSRSTAVEQMKTFFAYIKSRRIELEGVAPDYEAGSKAQGGLYALIDIWLRVQNLIDPKIVVDDVVIHWELLTDVPADVMLKSVQWAHMNALISDRQALTKVGLIDENDRYDLLEEDKVWTPDKDDLALPNATSDDDALEAELSREWRAVRNRLSA